MSSIQVDVVSAEESIFSGPAKFVALPGEAGELGILPGHVPLITRIKPGAVRIELADGGEEFVLLLPNTDLKGAYELAQEVLQAIDNLAIPHKSSKAAKHVSVSIGLSALIPNTQNSINTLIDNADEGVYAAKKAGRHRIRMYPTPQEVTQRREAALNAKKVKKT